MCDFAKAFDKVSHRALIKKLELYGFKGKLFIWLKDFLTYRKQRVVIGDESSEWLDVLSGVPQGSVLGPLLFVIFINDMPQAIKTLCKLFADDTKLIGVIRNPLDIATLQRDIDCLVRWAEDWLMDFNVDKCKYMTFNNKHFDINLKMNGQVMSKTENERDLGIMISSNLKWSLQVSVAAKRANMVLGQLSKAFKSWSISTFKKLYVTFVRPHLEYAVVAWCPYTKKDILVLEKVQMRATKLVKSLRHLSYEARLEKLGLTTLSKRRERGDLVEYFKIANGFTKVDWHNPNKLCNSISCSGPARSIRGHQHRMTKQMTKISQRENFILNRVVDNWNGLPPEIVKAGSKNLFKKMVDAFNSS